MTNSYIDGKLVWYRNNEVTDQVETSLPISFSSSANNNPVNNTMTLSFPNLDIFYTNGELSAQENDTMVFYFKEVISNDDVDITDTDIIWTGKFIDYTKERSPDSDIIKLKIADWGYDVFNRYVKKSYYTEELRTPFIYGDAIRDLTENVDGSGNFNLNVKYVGWPRTDGIQVTRSNGGDQSSIEFTHDEYLAGTGGYITYNALSDDYKFPVQALAFQLKPFYELANELGTITYTNTEAESISGLVVIRNMVFRIEGQTPIWYEPTTDVDLVLTEEDLIDSIKESSGNEAAVNFLILDCGVDFEDRPITAFLSNPLSTSTVTKESAEKKQALGGGNTAYDQQYHQLKKQFTLSTNDDFRDEVRRLAKTYADIWFELFGEGKAKISVTTQYKEIQYGQIIQLDIPKFKDIKYQVTSVAHSFNARSFTTTIQAKELSEF